jgi:hypothetical protein
MVGLKPDKCLQRGFKDKGRLEMVGSYSCMICGKEANVHHLAGIGAGKKASDLLTFPICHFHHQGGDGVHNGIEEWEKKYKPQLQFIYEINERIFKDKTLKGKDLERYYLIKNYCENEKEKQD